MDRSFLYEICVEGQLAERWSDWFEGMTITNDPDGNVMLSGVIPDQAALFGVLNRLHNLNLTLVCVSRRPLMSPQVPEPV